MRKPNERYVYDTAKSQSLDEATTLTLAGQFWQNGKATGWSKGMDWWSTVNEAISEKVLAAARQRQQTEY